MSTNKVMKRSKVTKVTKTTKVDQELELFICLDDGNEFPPWFTLGSNKEFLRIPMSKLTNKQMEDKYVFDYTAGTVRELGLYVGDDTNYLFYLTEIVVTKYVTNDDNFKILLFVTPIIKPSRKKRLSNYLKKIGFEYIILCPIIQ